MLRLSFALEILEACLSWDFDLPSRIKTLGDTSPAQTNDIAVVALPSDWASILLSRSFLQELFRWIQLTSQNPEYEVQFHLLLQCFYTLCCSPEFISNSNLKHLAASPSSIEFCNIMFEGMQLLLFEMTSRYNPTLLSGVSNMVRRLCLHFPLDTTLSHVPGFLEFLSKVAQLTIMSLTTQGKTDDERACLEETSEELIRMWARFGMLFLFSQLFSELVYNFNISCFWIFFSFRSTAFSS
jgi:hypothetical protein